MIYLTTSQWRRHLGCFQSFPISNKPAVKNLVQTSFPTGVSVSINTANIVKLTIKATFPGTWVTPPLSQALTSITKKSFFFF